MTEQHVSITAAFSDAWARMLTILFRPFNFAKWMVLGFTAWLAGLTQGGQSFSWSSGGTDSGNSDFEISGAGSDWPDWDRWSGWLLEHPLWFAAGVLGCASLIVLIVVILWLSSRGKFMFLDNVVHDRAEVVRPWNRYRRLANSYLGFQLSFIALMLVIMAAVGLFLFALTASSVMAFGEPPLFLGVVVGVLGLLAFGFAVAYAQFFLDAFVVPVMYRYDLGVLAAWSHFGKIFHRHPGTLILSGPFLLVLGFAVVLAVIMAGLLTCCIGLVLVVIPYIGTVILLPVPVTYRAFTVALLDQIDPGYFPD